MTRNLQRALAREAELGAKMEELSMSFSQSLEIRDSNTAGHSRDVLQLGTIIAFGIGISIDRKLKDSLLLHDIGKLGIPDRILLKESPLDDEEWKIMKTHPELGAGLLGTSSPTARLPLSSWHTRSTSTERGIRAASRQRRFRFLHVSSPSQTPITR